MAGDGGAGALGGLLGQGLGGPFQQQVAAQAGVVFGQLERCTPEARAKAHGLLIMHLDEQQRADFEERHYFDVMKGERHYRIICTGSISHNVKLLDEAGKVKYSFCCYPADGYAIPPEDVWLAQKLNIEAAEAEFLLTAVKNEPFPARINMPAFQQYYIDRTQAEALLAAQQFQAMQPGFGVYHNVILHEDNREAPITFRARLSRWLRRTR